MQFNPLPGPFGVEAHDVNLAQPLSDADFKRLEAAFYENHVLGLRAQDISAASCAIVFMCPRCPRRCCSTQRA